LRPTLGGAKLNPREVETMIGRRDDEAIELECTECGALVKTTAAEAEKGRVRCPRGHVFAVMGMLGRPSEDEPR
jgi:hypothetical protein